MSITKASLIDLNGQELILDADADTSITAYTDDQIDIKIAGSDKIHIVSTGLGINGTSTINADLHLGAASPHIDIGPAGGNRGKVGFDSNNVFIGSTSGTGEVILKNNIGSTDGPEASGDELARFGDTIVFNESSNDVDFRVESDGNANMLVVDGGNNQVGVGTSPSFTFHVSGSDVNSAVFDSDSDSGTYIWVRNSDATTGRTVNVGFAPANNIEGARISAEAMEDFSSSANRTADLAFQTRKDGTMSEKMRLDSHGTLTLEGEGGTDGYTIPFDQDPSYSNNLNAGAFSVLHRAEYDSYIVGNAYYYATGGSAGWRVKFGGYNSNVISMVNGRINFQATAGTVANNGDALNGLATSVSIDSDGLKFGTDTAAANALDDYEEGTLTFTSVAGHTNVSSVSQTYAEYTKIGSLIHIQAAFAVTPTSTGKTAIQFSSPFVFHSASNVGLIGLISAYPNATSDATGAILNYTGANNTQVYVETNMDGTAQTNFSIQMTYRT